MHPLRHPRNAAMIGIIFVIIGTIYWAVISRIVVQRRSSIGRRVQCAPKRATPVTPSTIRPRGRTP